ncbi:M15 family metallopeptidase [bacterium]|nr:M15 family metallopeptidase [bacterium]
MSRLLDDLDSRFRPLACELIARCAEQSIAVLIIDTLRTPEEQEQNIIRGVSWTKNSKHLPQLPENKSMAIDLAPFQQYYLHGVKKLQWDATDPAWHIMGSIGEGLGLRWGGRWRKHDLGHFEYKEME